jgi:hypothetical protein
VAETSLTENRTTAPGVAQTGPARSRVIAAWIIALAADGLQILVFPFFIAGVDSPFDAALDVVVGGALTWLLGFHWVFVPSAVAELVPVLDELPTWTASVFFVRRIWPGRASAPNPLAAVVSQMGAPARRWLGAFALAAVFACAAIAWLIQHRK